MLPNNGQTPSNSNQPGGNGGTGKTVNITGSDVVYGGGGGASVQISNTGGSGGSGGGGDGGDAGGTGTNGTDNLGGGGGGGSFGGGSSKSGGNGGKGIVIIAYPDTFDDMTIGAGLTFSLDTSSRSGYKVYSFTNGSDTVSF
jgi:hypothetical protein